MTTETTARSLQLRSMVNEDETLELSLLETEMPVPADDEVVIRVEAAPINPSDLGLFFGPADMRTAIVSGTESMPIVTAKIPHAMMRAAAARVGQSLPVGNEGAGVVVNTGSEAAARALMGKMVAFVGGGMYSQYRAARADQCLLLHEGTTAAEGASCFVNPLTVLGMVETMRMEKYSALIHTAAASNLGQMLVKLCVNEEISLVNIVRKQGHVDLLKGIGATHVCNSSSDSFMQDLIQALADTGATLAFDATGGGKLAGRILTAMEVAANLDGEKFGPYGSTVNKQVYIYGGLDRTPTQFNRNFGSSWGIGGWQLGLFLQKIGNEEAQKLRAKVAAEIKSTFASHYTREISLAQALQLDCIFAFGKMTTGEKFLINPNKT